jgi:hypothetical protein
MAEFWEFLDLPLLRLTARNWLFLRWGGSVAKYVISAGAEGEQSGAA